MDFEKVSRIYVIVKKLNSWYIKCIAEEFSYVLFHLAFKLTVMIFFLIEGENEAQNG